ncbi:VWA domain-containing protein [Aggregicoccus sp. 17bor-14]|uniref:vWA domain-containing protein n=1 Tax=Myxococcaceae TaxID=31 RepID=UPI00129D05FB|nr:MULTISPECIES: VWA domain-containing protein [Myxococcaceae]MBF5044931.1 VWA domain-containing protein [Simulacricoccus sp. 17bor-14]MRI90674.1 VWA domain-containing protein [Aggregicoccus sp. 17bor-14]
MNRTLLFVSLAVGLALSALVLGLPRRAAAPSPIPPAAAVPASASSGEGTLRLSGRLSHPVLPVGASELYLTVDVQGAKVPGTRRSPVSLALVIDRSGSMAGEKLAQARRAAHHLVSLLGPEDRLALVDYGSDVRGLPLLAATPENRERMERYIDALVDDGGTNISAGLARAAQQLAPVQGGVRRLILVSDGQPTEGLTDAAALLQQVRGLRSGQGLTLSAIGVGSDYDERLMQGLAETGAGAYGFLEDARQLATLFERDLQQATTAVARDVELAFELPEGVQLDEVLGYASEMQGRSVRVRLPDFSAGQLERVVARVRVKGARPGTPLAVAGLRLRYADLQGEGAAREVAVALQAQVTDRAEEVLARQDKEATVLATRARAAQNLERAAQALGEGRKDEARGLLQANQSLFQQAGAVASPAAVAADVVAQEEVAAQMERAEDGAAVGSAVKAARSKARKGYGRVGSTY